MPTHSTQNVPLSLLTNEKLYLPQLLLVVNSIKFHSWHMEVGCTGTWGTGTDDLTPKQPEQSRAHPTCNPATSPAYQKTLPQPQHPSSELEEQWKTY